jgi:hypothetical protein
MKPNGTNAAAVASCGSCNRYTATSPTKVLISYASQVERQQCARQVLVPFIIHAFRQQIGGYHLLYKHWRSKSFSTTVQASHPA